MRKIIPFLAAFWLALDTACAQPIIMPPNTVYGRLGGTVSGRGQAVPITSLLQSLQNTPFNYSQSVSGAVTGPVGNPGTGLNNITITADNATVTCVGGDPACFSPLSGLLINYSFGGSSVTNVRAGITTYVKLTAPTSASNLERDYIGGNFFIEGASEDNGTIGNTKGGLFAIGGGAIINSGLYWDNVTFMEANVYMAPGTGVRYRSGIQIVDNAGSTGRGTQYDAALAISNQSTSGWTYGILFGPMNGNQPVIADGTVIGSTGSQTVTSIIDFSSYSCSGGLAISFKSFSLGCTNGGGQLSLSATTGFESFKVSSSTTAAVELFANTAAPSQGLLTTKPQLEFITGSGTIMIMTAGVQVGAPAGGDKGAGTINAAAAYYANGTVGVSCGPGAPSAGFKTVNGIVTIC